MEFKGKVIVLISSNTEWQVIGTLFADAEPQPSPWGKWFVVDLDVGERIEPVLFFNGGWGKIAAAGSTQYVIDRWSPTLLINLGTCGGFKGEIEKGDIVLVEQTIVYDLVEQIGDYEEAINHYKTDIDLSWLGEHYPHDVRRTLIVSGDRDLVVEDIPRLKAEFGAVAGDWESGAIAYVAARNNIRCLILRGVSDLVGGSGGEAYDDNFQVFLEGAREVLGRLVHFLPNWIAKAI